MPDNRASYTVVLNTDGSAQVKGDLAQVAAWAQQSAAQTGAAYDKTATAAENASARAVAAARRAEEAERRRMAYTAQRIADAVDPTAPAQRTFDAESTRATAALKGGLVSQAQYDAYLLKLKNDLGAATGAMKEHGSVLGLNRAQYITAQSAVLRFGDSVIAGRNPLTALTLESHKLVEIMSLGEGGMAAALTQVSALFNPVVIGAAAVTAGLIAGAAAAYAYTERFDAMSRAADGFGRTSQLTGTMLLDTAAKHAQAGQISVGAATAIETAILQQTRTSDAALGQAIELTQRFADAMGTDVAKAAEQLGKSLANPAKAADDLTARFGYLTQAQVEQIHQLMEQNRLTEAQSALLADLDGSLDKAGEHVNALTRAWRALSAAMSNGWNDIGAAIDHAMGIYTDAEKIAELQGKIAADKMLIGNHGSQLFYDDAAARKQLADDEKALRDTMKPGEDARRNQLGNQAREIAGKYGLDTGVQPKLEQLKTELATLQDAQRAGQHVDADTVDALNHAIRTFMTPEQKRIAEQTARAALRQAAPHSAERERAGQQLMDATTSGEVVTEEGARRLAEERGIAALGHARGAGRTKVDEAAKNAAAMAAETAASLALAEAYLKSDAAALRAEASRKAAGEASRRNIDPEQQAARQLALIAAEQVATSAKAVRTAQDEATARQHVLAQVQQGLIPAKDMESALQRENALRPLVTLQTVLHGKALEDVTRVLGAYTKAMDGAQDANRAWAAQAAINAANDNARAERLRAQLAGVADPADRARQTAQATAAQGQFSPTDTTRYADAAAEAARAKQAADTATWLANEQQRHDRAVALYTVQATGDEDAIARQTLLNQLAQQNITLTDTQIQQVLDGQKAEQAAQAQLKAHAAEVKQLQDIGKQSIDALLSPDGIQHWGQTWHNVIRQVLIELEQMAIINPLKNMLFGGGSGGGGGGGLGSLLGSLFGLGGAAGGGGGIGSSSVAGEGFGGGFDATSVGLFASGTDSAPGGVAMVGENGPELINLPSGAGVMTAGETRAALSGAGGNVYHMPITIDARGAGPREIDQLRVELRNFQREVPGIAFRTVFEQQQRGTGTR